ncbi:MAG TPA: FKBP-type peptidyl-prolyl cis-trans isomerase [Deltaproteobacteria bacterium]|nr:FKBP-type peptidyl-prolyl cis-trans isomerase [Deltaproteobacteria bacterium]
MKKRMKRFKLPLALALMAIGAGLIVYFLVAERFDPEKQEAVQQVTEKFMRQNRELLENNPQQEGVVVTDSGLQYRILREGAGAQPTASSTVTVHYRGMLVEGSEFDSSHRRGKPASFPVSGLIPGWTEALQLMREGAKWELVVPAHLAYGEQGVPDLIPPNAVLRFEVELLKVN